MRTVFMTGLICLLAATSLYGQEVAQRLWVHPAAVELSSSTEAIPDLLVPEIAMEGGTGTLWLRGALIGSGVGALLGGVAALVPMNVMNDGNPTFIGDFTFGIGGVGLLVGGVIGGAIGNEYKREP